MDLFSDDDVLRGINLDMLSGDKKPNENLEGDDNDPLLNFPSSTARVLNTEEEEEEEDEENNPPTTPPAGTEDSDDEDDDAGDNNADEVVPMKAFASLVAKKLDIDYKEEEFEDTDDFIVSLAEKKAEALFKEKEAQLPEELKELWENYKEGVPIHAQIRAKENTFSYKSIDVEKVKENAELQKALIKDSLINKGLSDEKAEAKIKRYEVTGVLEDEALDSLEDLIAVSEEHEKVVIEQHKEAKVKALKEHEEWKSSLKESIDKKEEIIPGIKLDPGQKKALYEGITNTDKSGKNAIHKFYESNPDFNLVVAYLATVLKGDLSVLQTSATTKVTRNLKDILQTNSKDGGVTSAPPKIKTADVSVMKNALGINK